MTSTTTTPSFALVPSLETAWQDVDSSFRVDCLGLAGVSHRRDSQSPADGAALTYARRYALFALVGIAGEDDLDAPGLCDGPPPPSASALGGPVKPTHDQPPGAPRRPVNGYACSGMNCERPAILDSDRSAELREKLLLEIANIRSPDLGTSWARDALGAKNRLTAGDAKLVEDAFERRLLQLPASETTTHAEPQESLITETAEMRPAKGVDKSALAIAAPRRYRNREHLRSVAKEPCLICGRKPSDPHHLRYLQPRALGRKASDEFAVPLCRVHHRAVHRARDERAWGHAAGIDPIKVARKLWKDTRIDEGRIEPEGTPRAAAGDLSSQPGGHAAERQAPA